MDKTVLERVTQKDLEKFWSRVEKKDDNYGCWEWTALRGSGDYGRFDLPAVDGSPRRAFKAHRLSWMLANGREIPPGIFVCHKCDNRRCVRPDHLFLGSGQDNTNDMMIKKRSRHFKNNPYYGVQWTSERDRWRSWICINDDRKVLAYHKSLIDAARNYDRIAYICYGERDRLNFPEEYIFDGSVISERRAREMSAMST